MNVSTKIERAVDSNISAALICEQLLKNIPYLSAEEYVQHSMKMKRRISTMNKLDRLNERYHYDRATHVYEALNLNDRIAELEDEVLVMRKNRSKWRKYWRMISHVGTLFDMVGEHEM